MTKKFHEELDGLKQEVLSMGEVARNAIKDSVESLARQDTRLVKKVFEQEKKLDAERIRIDKKCMDLTALHQPVAKDLRFLLTITSITGILERIGDMCSKVAEITKATAGKPLIKPLIDVPRMSEISQEMLGISLQAFRDCNVKPTEQLSQMDDTVDALYDQVYRELLSHMIEDPRKITGATHLMFVALHLERIADLACNLGARVVYMITDKRVRIK